MKVILFTIWPLITNSILLSQEIIKFENQKVTLFDSTGTGFVAETNSTGRLIRSYAMKDKAKDGYLLKYNHYGIIDNYSYFEEDKLIRSTRFIDDSEEQLKARSNLFSYKNYYFGMASGFEDCVIYSIDTVRESIELIYFENGSLRLKTEIEHDSINFNKTVVYFENKSFQLISGSNTQIVEFVGNKIYNNAYYEKSKAFKNGIFKSGLFYSVNKKYYCFDIDLFAKDQFHLIEYVISIKKMLID